MEGSLEGRLVRPLKGVLAEALRRRMAVLSPSARSRRRTRRSLSAPRSRDQDGHAAAVDVSTQRDTPHCRRRDGRDCAPCRMPAPCRPSCQRDDHHATHTMISVSLLSPGEPPGAFRCRRRGSRPAAFPRWLEWWVREGSTAARPERGRAGDERLHGHCHHACGGCGGCGIPMYGAWRGVTKAKSRWQGGA